MARFTQTFAAFGLLVTVLSSSSFADTYRHIDELANDIRKQTRSLERESRRYRHTPEYCHLVADVRHISQLAEHMHEVAHHHGSLVHLESDLRQLDSEFHHLEALFDRIERRAAHGHGHIHGGTAHVKRLLNCIEDDIHHLQDDLRSMRTPVHVQRPILQARPPFYPGPYASRGRGNYRRGNSGFALSIGGGSSRFTLQF